MGLKNSILFTLADEQPHNTAEICDTCGISASTLALEIASLQGDDLDIQETGEGDLIWRQSFKPLNEADIWQAVSTETKQRLPDIDLHYELNSTNDFLRARKLRHPAVCLAEKQRQGKGRQGRHWISPVGRNIYLSVNWFYQQAPVCFEMLSLITAVAVTQALRSMGYQDVAIKWPNDIYLNDSKLGGILLETHSQSNEGLGVVAGIGLNVAMEADTGGIDQPWTSLSDIDRAAPDRRAAIIGGILDTLLPLLEQFEKQAKNLHHRWHEYDATYGKQVKVLTSTGTITGEAAGIDSRGRFLLHTDQGLCSFHAGDVSLRLP